jgi:dihydrofolate reductase
MYSNCELIVACDKNGAIGASATNSIPWHVPEDLAHFRQITTETPNSVIVMGRKTFESFGGKLLKDRINIVLTKNTAFHRGNFSNVHFANYSNVPHLFDKYKEHRIFIIGGRDIYDMFFDMCKVIHLSIIHVESGGDILFPRTIDESLFTVTKSDILVSRVAETPYQFITYTYLTNLCP